MSTYAGPRSTVPMPPHPHAASASPTLPEDEPDEEWKENMKAQIGLGFQNMIADAKARLEANMKSITVDPRSAEYNELKDLYFNEFHKEKAGIQDFAREEFQHALGNERVMRRLSRGGTIDNTVLGSMVQEQEAILAQIQRENKRRDSTSSMEPPRPPVPVQREPSIPEPASIPPPMHVPMPPPPPPRPYNPPEPRANPPPSFTAPRSNPDPRMSGYGRKSTSPVQDRHSPSNDTRSSRTRAPTSPAAISPGITPHAYHTSTSQPAYFDPPISSSSSSLSRSQTWTEATKNQHHAYHQPGGTAPLRTKRSQASLNSTPVNRSGTVPNILRSRTSQGSFHAPPPPRTESPERYRGSTGPVVPPTHPWYGQNANGFAPPWMDSEMTAEPEAENETETETEEETEEEGEVEFEEDEEDEEEYEEPPPRRSVPVPSTRPTSVPEREITSPRNSPPTARSPPAPAVWQPPISAVEDENNMYGRRRGSSVRSTASGSRTSILATFANPNVSTAPSPPSEPTPSPDVDANMQRETAQRQEAERSWESKEREKGKGKGKGKAPQRQRTISDQQQQQQQQQQYPRSSQNHNHNDHVSGGRTSESEGSSTFARPPDSNSITPLRTFPASSPYKPSGISATQPPASSFTAPLSSGEEEAEDEDEPEEDFAYESHWQRSTAASSNHRQSSSIADDIPYSGTSYPPRSYPASIPIPVPGRSQPSDDDDSPAAFSPGDYSRYGKEMGSELGSSSAEAYHHRASFGSFSSRGGEDPLAAAAEQKRIEELAEQARQREEAARAKEAAAQEKEAAAQQKEADLKQKEEESERKLREITEREAALRRREEEFQRMEDDRRSKEEAARQEAAKQKQEQARLKEARLKEAARLKKAEERRKEEERRREEEQKEWRQKMKEEEARLKALEDARLQEEARQTRLKEKREREEARLKEERDMEARLKEERETEEARVKEEREARLKEERQREEAARLKEQREREETDKHWREMDAIRAKEEAVRLKQEQARAKAEEARVRDEREKEDARLKEERQREEAERLWREREDARVKEEARQRAEDARLKAEAAAQLKEEARQREEAEKQRKEKLRAEAERQNEKLKEFQQNQMREAEARKRADERKRQGSMDQDGGWTGPSSPPSWTRTTPNSPAPSSTASSSARSNSTAGSSWSSSSKASSTTSASSTSRASSSSTATPNGKPTWTSASSSAPPPSYTPSGNKAPPRAGSASSQSSRDPPPTNSDDWARRQQQQAEEQFRRMQEQMERERQAKEQKAGRMLTKEDVVKIYQTHEQQWAKMSAHAEVTWDMLPWPVYKKANSAEDITSGAVDAYIMSPHYPDADKSTKDRIRQQLRRWHEDHFNQKVLSKVSERDKDRVKAAAGTVTRNLNNLLERTNESKKSGSSVFG